MPSPPRERDARIFTWAVVAACALHVALVAWAGPGFMSSDDEVYARAANDLAHGAFELRPDHHWNRVGLIAPVAFAYLAMGVGPWTTIATTLVATLIGIVAVACVARGMAGPRAGALAALLAAPLVVLVNGSTFLMPDVPLAVLLFLSSAALARKTSQPLDGALAAALVATAVLVKETAAWILPFHGALFLRDVIAGRRGLLWAGYVATGLVAAGAFFGAYHAATGDALYRIHAIDAVHNASEWAYVDAGLDAILRRLTYEPAILVLSLLPEVALLLVAAVGIGTGDAHGTRYWSAHAAVLAGGYWLGTTSLSSWSPLPLFPRMLAPAVPPLIVLAACALARTGPVRPRAGRLAAAALVVAAGCAHAVASDRPLVALLYVGGAGAIAAPFVAGGRGLARAADMARLALPAFLVAICSYGIVRGGVGESPEMRAERHAALALDETIGAPAVVLSDARTARAFRHFRGHRSDDPIILRDWHDPDAWSGHAALHVVLRTRPDASGIAEAAPPDAVVTRLPAALVVVDAPPIRIVRLSGR